MALSLDLVQDSRLETEFRHGHVVHTFIEPYGEHRRARREEHWKVEQHVGRGSFGQVQLEKCIAGLKGGTMRAVKVIDKGLNSHKPMDFKRELETIAKFSNDRYNSWFVKSFGWYEDPTSVFIAMEYCRHGDLHHYLLSKHSIPAAEAQQLTHQILEGLHQMHKNGFAHRDLKPGNILIKSKPPDNWWVVLADFGISKRAEEGYGPSTVKGTEQFMAPELRGLVNPVGPSNTPDYKAGDMWALGEIAFRMLTGEAAFLTLLELMEYCMGKRPYPSNRLTSSAGDSRAEFISNLMAIDPTDRMTSAKALDHSWVESQHISIEEDFVALNLEQTDPQGITPLNTIQDASARWTTLSDIEATRQTVLGRAINSSPLYEENSFRASSQPYQAYQTSHNLLPTQNFNDASEQEFLPWSELQTLKGHSSAVCAVAFSPDGQRLASGSWDRTVRLWDARSGTELQTLKGHSDAVSAVAFSPDGQRLASGSWDRTVRLWDARSGTELQTLKGHSSAVCAVAFSPDGQRLASGSWDGTVRLWDARSGTELQTLKGHSSAVSAVAFSPDGQRLASGSWDGTVRLWDARSGTELQTLKGHSDAVSAVAFSPDGQRLASGSWDRTVRLWDARSGTELQTLKGHSSAVCAVAFSPDGQRLASGSWDRTVRLWDARSGTELQTLKGHSDEVWAVAFSPDGQRLASGSRDGTVRLWDARSEVN